MAGLKISSRLNNTKAAYGGKGPNLWPIVRGGALVVTLLTWGAALMLLVLQLLAYRQQVVSLPYGLTMAGIPVGGLSEDEARARLDAVYLEQPITLTYQGATIEMPASAAGVTIDYAAMFAQVEAGATPGGVAGFWDHLWGRAAEQTEDIPLVASYSEAAIAAFLRDVAARYDPVGYPAYADPVNMVTFTGTAGAQLDVATSTAAVAAVALQPTGRQVQLVAQPVRGASPTLDMLRAQIVTYLAAQGVDGLFTLYVQDLQTGEVLHLTLRNGSEVVPNTPDVAYSGMSIMKILIMVEFYRQIGPEGALPYELDLVAGAITESSNYTSNLLINWIGDLNDGTGLYRINETAAALGMENTFLGGLYDTQEAPGFRFTPANQRADVNTGPDVYMQTTASDMGRLLAGIYQCAESDSGLLVESRPGEWTPEECRAMLDYLVANQIGVLVQGGVPAGTTVGHKHAWGDGRTIGDASIVFSAGGDFVLVYYIWRPDYAYWEPNKVILESVAKAVYHYFNPLRFE